MTRDIRPGQLLTMGQHVLLVVSVDPHSAKRYAKRYAGYDDVPRAHVFVLSSLLPGTLDEFIPQRDGTWIPSVVRDVVPK